MCEICLFLIILLGGTGAMAISPAGKNHFYNDNEKLVRAVRSIGKMIK